MLDVREGENGTIILSGRFDASQERKAQAILDGIHGFRTLDFTDLEYISSAGLGALLRAQKRLKASGGGLRLIHLNKHIHDIFRFSGFDRIFDIG